MDKTCSTKSPFLSDMWDFAAGSCKSITQMFIELEKQSCWPRKSSTSEMVSPKVSLCWFPLWKDYKPFNLFRHYCGFYLGKTPSCNHFVIQLGFNQASFLEIKTWFLASWIPCLQVFYGFSNAAMVGQPGFCASQGLLCLWCCCPCAYLLWTTKTRYYTKMRLGINVSRIFTISSIRY